MEFSRCLCTPNARVMVVLGQVYCTRCLAPRCPLRAKDVSEKLGNLGYYYKPKVELNVELPRAWPTPLCRPGGVCWLTSIFPLARMTSGNFNFMKRLELVARVLYRDMGLTKHALQELGVEDRGCNWYQLSGPVPGIAVYANAHHVSDTPFPGCTHVLTNLPLPQQKCKSGFCPFDRAEADVYNYKGKIVYLSSSTGSWALGTSPEGVTPYGRDKWLCERLTVSVPAGHVVTLDFSHVRDGFSFNYGHRAGYLTGFDFNYGLCWARLFESVSWKLAAREVDLADRLGYQLPTGVAGAYLSRRLHVNGLRAVVKEVNDFHVWAYGSVDSWVRHITDTGVPPNSDYCWVGGFSLVNNTEVTSFKKFNFGRLNRYGYSPPGDGSCGLHCISAAINWMTTGNFSTTLPTIHRDSEFWLDNRCLEDIILTLNLPISVGMAGTHCPLAVFRMSCVDHHWVIKRNKKIQDLCYGLSPACVRGVCGGSCTPVPTVPILCDVTPATTVTPDMAKYSLGVEPYCDFWCYSSGLLLSDGLSTSIKEAGGALLTRLGLSPDDGETILNELTNNCQTRRHVLDVITRQLSLSPRAESVATTSAADECISAPAAVTSAPLDSKPGVLSPPVPKPRAKAGTGVLQQRPIPKPRVEQSVKERVEDDLECVSALPAVASARLDLGLGVSVASPPVPKPRAKVGTGALPQCPVPKPRSKPSATQFVSVTDLMWRCDSAASELADLVDSAKRYLVLSTNKQDWANQVITKLEEYLMETRCSSAESLAIFVKEGVLNIPHTLTRCGVDSDTVSKIRKLMLCSPITMPRGVGIGSCESPENRVDTGNHSESPGVELEENEGSDPVVTVSHTVTEPTAGEELAKPVPAVKSETPFGRFFTRFKLGFLDALNNCLGNWVFSQVSYLHAAVQVVMCSKHPLNQLDYGYTLFCLLMVMLGLHYPAFAFLPVIGCVTGSPWRVRLSVFSCWLGIAIVVFNDLAPEPGLVCTSASQDCGLALQHYTDAGRDRPVSGVCTGVAGLSAVLVAKLVGGSRFLWTNLLRLLVLLDFALVCIAFSFRTRCKKCFGRCVRCAPSEIPLRTFPLSKCSKSALLDLCDRFDAPRVDPIMIATGYPGCWRGQSPSCVQTTKPIPYQSLDEKKTSSSTVVPPPIDPQQAVKCLKVLQSGGAMQDVKLPEVVAVTQVPYRAPFFPKVRVNPDCYVVVDPETYTAALRNGYSVQQLLVGTGDFAKINKLTFSKGGYLPSVATAVVYCCISFLLGSYLMSPVSCGVGTTDPWCRNPFSYPVFGSGVMCSDRLCVSDVGLTAPVLLALSLRAWIFGIATLASVVVLLHKYTALVDTAVVFAALTLNLFPAYSIIGVFFPLILFYWPLHPIVVIWTLFLLASVNVWAGVASAVVCVAGWLLARSTGSVGLVSPYDVHLVTRNPRGAAAVVAAPEGSYLAAVRRAALTGRCCFFVPSQFGNILEGCLRSKRTAPNVVTVFGASSGTGGVFTINGMPTVITATHLLSDDHKARVSSINFSEVLQFSVSGDFAQARITKWNGPAPTATFDGVAGKAYWLTASGVEPGFVGTTSAFCYTACGDSGSPVVDESGNIIGVHTGSNKRGMGMVSLPSGKLIGMSSVRLSEMSAHYAGPCVSVDDSQIPAHVIKDVSTVPSDLLTVLTAAPTPEGGLSTVQVLAVFFMLWRLIYVPGVPVVAIGFFVLNEILPATLVRLIFSLALSVGSLFTHYSGQVVLLRLLTATLNRSKWSFWFHITGAIVAGVSQVSLSGDVTLSTWYFVPRDVVVAAQKEILIIVVTLHVLALLLSIFKCNALTDVLVGNGHFDKGFFLKYFTEGSLRDGVSKSCNLDPEGLTAALAVNLSDDDLSFLNKISDLKCFASASNMRNGANQFIEVAYAKALRQEAANCSRYKVSTNVLAKLEAFMAGATCDLNAGDLVVILGTRGMGETIELPIGKKVYLVRVMETRSMAGTKFTISQVVGSLENDASDGAGGEILSKKEQRKLKRLGNTAYQAGRLEEIGTVTVDGSSFKKFWDKRTGDIFYKSADEEGYLITENKNFGTFGLSAAGHFQKFVRKHGEFVSSGTKVMQLSGRKQVEVEYDTYRLDGELYDIPRNEPREWVISDVPNLEAQRLTVEQAVAHLGHNVELTNKEKEKLQRIISKLQGLTSEQALNSSPPQA
uniref:1a n=1 Tax=Bamboo rat arterivirus TaxID=3038165 RepID=A0AAT9TXN8_9NIDO|nr:1a [Bamboo rat arterivirus]